LKKASPTKPSTLPKGWVRYIVIPDTHAPFHNRKALALVFLVARTLFAQLKPEQRGLITLGDFFDFFAVSFHSKAPDRRDTLEHEVDEGNELLDYMDKLGAQHKYFIEGNHEHRLGRYLAEKAPELFGLVSVQKLFKFEQRGWKFIPYKRSLQLGKQRFTHDLERAGANAHRQAIIDVGLHNIIIGHTHRLGYEVIGCIDGIPHLGCALGWLGDHEDVDYRHRDRALREWSLGFGVVDISPEGYSYVQPVPILPDFSCMAAGQHIKL
jgi:hypothetical protein